MMPAREATQSSSSKSSLLPAKAAPERDPRPAAKRTTAAAKSGAKATATSTRKAASHRHSGQSGATKTAPLRAGRRRQTRRSAQVGRSSARMPRTPAARPPRRPSRLAPAPGARPRRARRGSGPGTAKGAPPDAPRRWRAESITSVAEQLAQGAITPREVVMLTRDRIQETFDEAASRGRITRKDANDLVAELVRRGRQQSDDLMGELEQLLGRGRGQLEAATKIARKSEPSTAWFVPAIAPGAPWGWDHRSRSSATTTSRPLRSRARSSELSKPDLRKVLTYERRNAGRKERRQRARAGDRLTDRRHPARGPSASRAPI